METLEELNWMDDQSKEKAREKVRVKIRDNSSIRPMSECECVVRSMPFSVVKSLKVK